MTIWTPTCEIGTTPGVEPAGWTDVSSRVLAQTISETHGRRDELSQPSTSRCRLQLDNYDGNWDEGIAPNTAIRLTVSDGTATVALFYGLVESAPAVWPSGGFDDRVDVELVGPEVVMSRDEVDAGPFVQQTTGARIGALLDLAGWPAGMRDVDTGLVLVDAVTEAEPVNILRELRTVAEIEDGVLWVAPDGTLTFRDRRARLDLTVTATFDVDSAEAFTDLEPSFDDGPLWTAVRAEMANGDTYDHLDSTAADLYGRRVLLIRDMDTTWYEVNALASWRLRNYATPRRRMARLTVGLGNAAAPVLEVGDLVEVNHVRPSGGTVTEQAVIEQVTRGATRHGFNAVYTLSPYVGEGPWHEWLSDGALTGDGWLSDVATEGAMWAP